MAVSTATIYTARMWLYALFAFFSFMLLAFTAARLNYTLHLQRGDPLNGGHDFYDPSVAELIFCAIVGLIWAPFMFLVIRRRLEGDFLTRIWFEVTVLALLCIFWLAGAAAATNVWPDLSFCVSFNACRVLQTMMAFAWLGWMTITILLVGGIVFAVVNKSWMEHAHWDWVESDPQPDSASYNVSYSGGGGGISSSASKYGRNAGVGPGMNISNPTNIVNPNALRVSGYSAE